MDAITQDFVKFGVQQGGVTLVAVFAIWQLTKVQTRYDVLLSRVLEVLDKNTAALTSLTSSTDRVADVVSSCGVNRRHGEK